MKKHTFLLYASLITSISAQCDPFLKSKIKNEIPPLLPERVKIKGVGVGVGVGGVAIIF